MEQSAVEPLNAENKQDWQFGVLGEPLVNMLKLNLALTKPRWSENRRCEELISHGSKPPV